MVVVSSCWRGHGLCGVGMSMFRGKLCVSNSDLLPPQPLVRYCCHSAALLVLLLLRVLLLLLLLLGLLVLSTAAIYTMLGRRRCRPDESRA